MVVIATVILGLPLLALAARSSTKAEPEITTRRADDRLVVGYVADLGSPDGAEGLKGIRVWQSKLASTTQGIPYAGGRLAAVKVLVLNSKGSSRVARSSARRLVARGATILIGPAQERELEAVVGVATATSTPLVSLVPRPMSVPRHPMLTFLYRPPVGSMGAAFDALDVHVRRRRGKSARPRVGILAVNGPWAQRARLADQLATTRAYRTQIRTLSAQRRQPLPELQALRASRPDMLVVFAPWERAASWFARLRSNSDPAWIIPTDDPARARVSRTPLILSVPWSPANPGGGPVFLPGEFQLAYSDRYGKDPTVPAAAAAAACVVVTEAVSQARSTDTTRVLKAVGSLRTESFWGSLTFEDGQQVIRNPELVTVSRSGISRIKRLPTRVPPRVQPVAPEPSTPQPAAQPAPPSG